MRSEKITKERRSYDDACAAAHALDLVGDRWALLVIRELMLGPRRFADLRAGLPGISANVLTQRLEELERHAILRRHRLPPPAAAQVYALTEWGLEAEPIFQALGRWAARSPTHDPTLAFSAASLVLSLRTMLDPARAGGLDAWIGLDLGSEAMRGHLAGGMLQFERGDPRRADATFIGAPPAVAAAIYGGQPLAALEAAGALRLAGDRALAARFVTLFPLPPKAPSPPETEPA